MEILLTLKKLYDTRGDEIERWMTEKRKTAAPFIYTSVDLRHSGQRLAPVDTNLFPAGFNNLSPAAAGRATRFFARYLQDNHPRAKKLLLIPENHTRNLPYLDNLAMLVTLLENAGAKVELGSLAATAGNPVKLTAPSGRELTQYPLVRDGDKLALENGYTPDLVVMNNDMTAAVPKILCSLAQPVVPPVSMGWHQRRKSIHFAAYRALVDDFCNTFALDPWLLAAEFHACGMVDFKEESGLDCMAKGVEKVLARVRGKYREHGITDDPYVFIKADSGTYGMGIMTVKSADEIFELNKKARNKMNVVKEGARVSEVIIQEGIPTADSVDGKPAEPMVYLVDGIPAGGMYRVNGSRDTFGNLNAAGMEFTGMCDEMEDECGKWKTVDDCNFRSFGIVAAIAALASAREDYLTGNKGEGI